MTRLGDEFKVILEARCRVAYYADDLVVAYACDGGLTSASKLVYEIHWNDAYYRDAHGNDIRLSWEDELVIRQRIKQALHADGAELVENHSP